MSLMKKIHAHYSVSSKYCISASEFGKPLPLGSELEDLLISWIQYGVTFDESWMKRLAYQLEQVRDKLPHSFFEYSGYLYRSIAFAAKDPRLKNMLTKNSVVRGQKNKQNKPFSSWSTKRGVNKMASISVENRKEDGGGNKFYIMCFHYRPKPDDIILNLSQLVKYEQIYQAGIKKFGPPKELKTHPEFGKCLGWGKKQHNEVLLRPINLTKELLYKVAFIGDQDGYKGNTEYNIVQGEIDIKSGKPINFVY